MRTSTWNIASHFFDIYRYIYNINCGFACMWIDFSASHCKSMWRTWGLVTSVKCERRADVGTIFQTNVFRRTCFHFGTRHDEKRRKEIISIILWIWRVHDTHEYSSWYRCAVLDCAGLCLCLYCLFCNCNGTHKLTFWFAHIRHAHVDLFKSKHYHSIWDFWCIAVWQCVVTTCFTRQ